MSDGATKNWLDFVMDALPSAVKHALALCIVGGALTFGYFTYLVQPISLNSQGLEQAKRDIQSLQGQFYEFHSDIQLLKTTVAVQTAVLGNMVDEHKQQQADLSKIEEKLDHLLERR